MTKYVKIVFLLVILGLFVNHSYAQIDDIKKGSRKNKNDKKDSGSSDYFGSGSDPDSPCMDACGSFLFEFVFSVAFEALAIHHKDLLDDKENDPSVISLELKPHFAYSPDDEIVNLLPGVRGTWGTISTDFRFNYLADYKDYSASIYKVYEWQILMLNIRPVKEFSFRLGSGIYTESFTDTIKDPVTQVSNTKKFKSTYNEHFVGLYLRLNDLSTNISGEGRFAVDYETGNQVFTEINLKAEQRLLHFKHLSTYAMLGFNFQRYYSKTNIYSVQAGFTFMIH